VGVEGSGPRLPCARIGDTVSADYECASKRELDSREDAGYVEIDTHITNQDGQSVFGGDMKFLFKRRNAE
jgi:acyl dehydratase